MSNDSPDDLTVYDLARRICDGMAHTEQAAREVAAELLRWAETIRTVQEWRGLQAVAPWNPFTALAAERCREALIAAIDTARAKESR